MNDQTQRGQKKLWPASRESDTMKARQKFSESRFGRVLPIAMTCVIAAEFVACGNKNGAREIITPGVTQVSTKATQTKANDPKLKERLKAATATRVKNADGTFTVTVSLLVANPSNQQNIWVVKAGGANVPVVVKGQAQATKSAMAAVDESLAGKDQDLPAPNAPTPVGGATKWVELQLDTKASAPEASQAQVKVHAVCRNAECSLLTVTYCEPTADAASAAIDRDVSSVNLSRLGRNNMAAKPQGPATAATPSVSSIKMHFVDAGDNSGQMIVDPNCTTADLPCKLATFQGGLIEAQRTQGLSLSPQPQGPPIDAAGTPAPAEGGANTDARPAATTPTQSPGETTTPAATTPPAAEETDAAAAATGTKGKDGAPGESDNK